MTQQFIVEYDNSGTPELREQHRAEHIAYRVQLGDALPLAGPLLDDGGAPIGSLIILVAEDRAEAERIAVSDPYVTLGVLALKQIRPFRIAKIGVSKP